MSTTTGITEKFQNTLRAEQERELVQQQSAQVLDYLRRLADRMLGLKFRGKEAKALNAAVADLHRVTVLLTLVAENLALRQVDLSHVARDLEARVRVMEKASGPNSKVSVN